MRVCVGIRVLAPTEHGVRCVALKYTERKHCCSVDSELAGGWALDSQTAGRVPAVFTQLHAQLNPVKLAVAWLYSKYKKQNTETVYF